MFSRKRMAVTIGFGLFVFLIAASVILRPLFGYPCADQLRKMADTVSLLQG
jgi:hypothetical protein